MSYVAWPNQTPIGTTSNFLQCQWVSCSKSYWQGYDLGWYKGMGAPCFPQPNLWLARCASMSWTALKKIKKFDVLFTQRLRVGKKPIALGICDRNVSFQPARNIPSLCWCLPPVPPASAKQGDRDCYCLFRQNVCTSGSSRQQQASRQVSSRQAAGEQQVSSR